MLLNKMFFFRKNQSALVSARNVELNDKIVRLPAICNIEQAVIKLFESDADFGQITATVLKDSLSISLAFYCVSDVVLLMAPYWV